MTDSAPTGVEGARHRMGPNMQLQRAELRSAFASSLSLGTPATYLPWKLKEVWLPGRGPATVNGFDRYRAHHLEGIKSDFH